ncbi:hypothetical protein PPL_08369 [Heterostelium album PN500]|uniref:H-type lectin domain-containing protein n=1 Tax=Heterostelium pallidum (strain ATCC 26659 / Pp 5 / PN500) TaxID=670386 RepID=D3BI01_HETP5|nr:hypothetical protein PPL_08369 [Heterostelium album PN500]EFA78901.1 hypothetical protein PPL_08369 [Heterostelium album PN500]|eukprot:XP_020431025.1 hypothetical protein PPL_08369 [Heterostelium album PN500]
MTCTCCNRSVTMIDHGSFNYVDDVGHVVTPPQSAPNEKHPDVKEKFYLLPVKFATPFPCGTTPKVSVAIACADQNQNKNFRVYAKAVNITNTGFNVKYVTWADSDSYGYGALWIATFTPSCC